MCASPTAHPLLFLEIFNYRYLEMICPHSLLFLEIFNYRYLEMICPQKIKFNANPSRMPERILWLSNFYFFYHYLPLNKVRISFLIFFLKPNLLKIWRYSLRVKKYIFFSKVSSYKQERKKYDQIFKNLKVDIFT